MKIQPREIYIVKPDAWETICDWSFAGGRRGRNITQLLDNQVREEATCKSPPVYLGIAKIAIATPPLKRALRGTFFLDRFEQFCQIIVLTVPKCHKASWQP